VEKHGATGQATDDNIIRRMHIEFRVTTATDTHSEYVIHIALPREQWLRERASVLHYTTLTVLFLCTRSITTPYQKLN
jgi:hypothetical protein